MITIAILCWLGSSGLCLAGQAGNFHSLLQEHWANAQKEQVFFRTDPDAFRPNGKLPEVTAEARARRQDYNQNVLNRLEAIDEESLQGQDRISYRLFLYERETERDS